MSKTSGTSGIGGVKPTRGIGRVKPTSGTSGIGGVKPTGGIGRVKPTSGTSGIGGVKPTGGTESKFWLIRILKRIFKSK
jgi:hypothetical protein